MVQKVIRNTVKSLLKSFKSDITTKTRGLGYSNHILTSFYEKMCKFYNKTPRTTVFLRCAFT